MRVLYYYDGQHIDSGSPKALLGLVDVLDRERVVPMFLATGEGPLIDALEQRDVEIIRGPKVKKVSHRHPICGLAGMATFARLLSSNRVDLLHVNEFGWNLDLVLGAPLARVPVVLHMHLPGSIDRQNLHRFVARRVLLVSHAHEHAIAHFERISSKAEVMYNAVDLERFAHGRGIRTELGLTADDIVVGSLAQLRHGKGIDVLLGVARELLPRYPRLVFLVAGRLGHGEEAFGRAMMEEAQSPALLGRFKFLGSRQDVPELLASFDVFVLPTRAETFGIAVVEAMAAGVPVIASRVGAIPEIISSAAVGRVVDEVDVKSFAAVLEEIVLLGDRGRGIGEAGRHSLTGRFDASSLSVKLHSIYENVRHA